MNKVQKPPLTLIVAAAQNDVIGQDNALPWHLPRDLLYFKSVTIDCPIIMGRKTYESIGKALPRRLNIVVTRNRNYCLTDAKLAHSLTEAVAVASSKQPDAKAIHIIGGATLFEESIHLVDKIYLNRVLATVEGDTFLPTVDWSAWQLLSQNHYAADENNAYAVDVEVYGRKSHTPSLTKG